jgi:predicted nucleotide-binding protein (sugar kinase/HSP70/actin superfamily)
MAIQRGRDLLEKSDATAEEIEKSISALNLDSEYVRKCVNAGLRDGDSGRKTIKEIADLVEQLKEKKLKCPD